MNSLKFIGMSTAVILLLCFIGETAAQNEPQDLDFLENEAEVLDTVRGLLQDAQSMLDPEQTDSEPDENKGCSCYGLQCTCCRYIRIKILRIKIKKNCCVKVTFYKATYQFEISVKLGSKTIFRRRFSVRKPRPVCVDASFVLRKGVSVCLRLYDVRVLGGRVSACVRLEFRAYGRTVARYKVDCFRIGSSGSSNEVVESVDQLELPAASSDGDDYGTAENDPEPAAFDGAGPSDGQEDGPFSPGDDEVIFMEIIGMPIENFGENKL